MATSSGFDVDKLDYFLRDAKTAGLPLRYDIDRYLYDVRVEKEILPDDKGGLEELYDRVKAKAKGPLRFREALKDFETAAQIDKTLADPHFVIGTVLYQMAIFDLADRSRYKIHKTGDFQGLKSRPPSMSFFVDAKNRAVLQAALDEFEEGRRLQQLHEMMEGGVKCCMFSPQDVGNRLHSIRCLLGYEPATGPDPELVMRLSYLVSLVEPVEGPFKVFR